MNIYNYPRGSEWCKWDLHVHTPISYENHFSGWDTYIKKLIFTRSPGSGS
ncbi:unnamed protein product [marine sediment metagenome]|uniref:Uncharacterized protein n=1 Tax=marine sediment metagenome TaxID=412755 RepID=X1FIT4_9ZZZZ